MKKVFAFFLLTVALFLIMTVDIYAADSFEINSVNSDCSGNIFFGDCDKAMVAEYINNTSSGIEVSVVYKVTDIAEKGTDKEYFTYSSEFTIPANGSYEDTVLLNGIKEYNVYELHILAQGGTETAEKTVPFSVCADGKKNGGNPMLGISGHVSWGSERLPDTAFEIAKNAGFTGVRDSYLWRNVESTMGIYTEPENYEKFFSAIEKNELDVCAIAAWGNTLYGMTSSTDMPQNDEQRLAYANYVYNMLEKHSDTIEWVQVWNEPNLNNSDLPAEDYVKMLKAVNERVRSNPEFANIKIVAPALARTITPEGAAWLEEFLATDLDGDGYCDTYKYFDVLSVQQYMQTFSLIEERLGYIRPLLSKYNCSDKPLYHTEYGTHQAYNNSGTDTDGYTTQEMQASRLARYYLTLQAQDMSEKLFLYALSDEPLGAGIDEQTYGITNSHDSEVPYSAKAGLLAMAFINNILHEEYDDSATNYRCDEASNVCIATFSNATGTRIVKAFYQDFKTGSEDETVVKYDVFADSNAVSIRFYDMYGNQIDYISNGDKYEIDVTYKVVYAVYEYGDSVSMYPDGNAFVVRSVIEDASEGDAVTIKILKNNEIVYVNQKVVDADKSFEFRFEVQDRNAQHIMQIGSRSFSGIYSMSFEPCEINRAAIVATNDENTVIDSLNEFDAIEKVVLKARLIDPHVDDFSVVVAYYNDTKLADTVIIDKEKMEFSMGNYVADIKSYAVDVDYDKVKVFMLDSITNITPLTKNIIFD